MAKPAPELNLFHRVLRLGLRVLIQMLGVLALLMWLLALTSLPGMAYGWLGRVSDPPAGPPELIVMMGGGGIPSESGLLRCYATAVQAHQHAKARVIVAMPYEPGEGPGRPSAVVQELMLRGVEKSRITQEGAGRHTREQALKVWALAGGDRKQPTVCVVSSPEHIRRSALAFRKAGFTKVAGAPAFSQHLQADQTLTEPTTLPNPAHSVLLRYRMWDNLLLEIKVLREYTALLYYRVRGWI